MKQKFTNHQARKLIKLGFINMSNCSQRKVVKYGNGNYSKKIGNVYITLQIRQHFIERFAFALVYQGTDFKFTEQYCDDLKEALNFIKNLGYFES